MSQPNIRPFSEGFSRSVPIPSNPASIPDVSFAPFSEGISFFQATILKEPPEVKRAFTNLRKAWLEQRAALSAGKTPPTAGQIRNARDVLNTWATELRETGKLDPETRNRVKNAMLTAKEYKAPISTRPSAAKRVKAEKIVKALAKESGKKLAAKTIGRYALRIIPFLGAALMVFPDVMDWIRSAKQAPATRKFIADLMAQPKDQKPEFSEEGNSARFHPRIPGGANYHPSVGWY